MEIKHKNIKEKLSSLDNSPPDFSWSKEGLWEGIQSKKSKERRIIWYAAASFLILFTTGVLILNLTGEHIKVSYTLEYEHETTQDPDLISMEDSALDFISESCRSSLPADVCGSKEFITLSNELASMQTEINEIDKMINRYGEDPIFIKSKIQIENLKSEITNKLIQMVLS